MGVGVDGGACGGGRPRAQEEEAPKGVAPLLWSAPTVLRSGGVAPGPSSPELVTMCACGSVSRLQGATPQLWSFFCILRLLPISFLKYIVFLQPI